MLAPFRRLFGAKRAPVATNAAADVLPVECQTILAGVSFAERGADEKGNPRLVVMLPRGGAFQYGTDTASTWLRERFGLTDTQMPRALQMLRARLADWQRMQTVAATGRRARWADWKPAHDIMEFD